MLGKRHSQTIHFTGPLILSALLKQISFTLHGIKRTYLLLRDCRAKYLTSSRTDIYYTLLIRF